MKVLEVKGLCKSYHKNLVLDDLTLSIEAGEFLGFAGANGTGKSTLLKCILDFCHYEKGEIRVCGALSRERQARGRLAFLPERFVPPYYLTGGQFLRMGMKLQGCEYDGREAARLLEELDLHSSALVKPVRSFSKGMTQKLGLLSCFMARRDFYILDEPMSGLDPKARALVKRQFRLLHERGASLFFTSHALADIEEVCSRMAVLHDRKIRFVGTPAEMRDAYPKARTLEEAYLYAITPPASTGAADAA